PSFFNERMIHHSSESPRHPTLHSRSTRESPFGPREEQPGPPAPSKRVATPQSWPQAYRCPSRSEPLSLSANSPAAQKLVRHGSKKEPMPAQPSSDRSDRCRKEMRRTAPASPSAPAYVRAFQQ